MIYIPDVAGWAYPVVARLDGQTSMHYFRPGRSGALISICGKWHLTRGPLRKDPPTRREFICTKCMERRKL